MKLWLVLKVTGKRRRLELDRLATFRDVLCAVEFTGIRVPFIAFHSSEKVNPIETLIPFETRPTNAFNYRPQVFNERMRRNLELRVTLSSGAMRRICLNVVAALISLSHPRVVAMATLPPTGTIGRICQCSDGCFLAAHCLGSAFGIMIVM
jgi:hypothetical protein